MGDIDDLRWSLEQVKAGKIKPTLDKVYDLHETRDAHARLAAGAAVGTIVLKPKAEWHLVKWLHSQFNRRLPSVDVGKITVCKFSLENLYSIRNINSSYEPPLSSHALV